MSDEHKLYRHVNLRSTRHEYGNRMEQNLRSEQLHVSAHLPEMNADMRPVCREVERTPSRVRRMNDRYEANKAAIPRSSVLGLRANIGVVVLAAILVFTLCFCLWSWSRVNKMQKRVNVASQSVTRTQETLETVRLAYESSAASVDVAYNARDLGMVSAKSVKPITLTVPEDALIQPSDTPLELPLEYFATIMGR